MAHVCDSDVSGVWVGGGSAASPAEGNCLGSLVPGWSRCWVFLPERGRSILWVNHRGKRSSSSPLKEVGLPVAGEPVRPTGASAAWMEIPWEAVGGTRSLTKSTPHQRWCPVKMSTEEWWISLYGFTYYFNVTLIFSMDKPVYGTKIKKHSRAYSENSPFPDIQVTSLKVVTLVFWGFPQIPGGVQMYTRVHTHTPHIHTHKLFYTNDSVLYIGLYLAFFTNVSQTSVHIDINYFFILLYRCIVFHCVSVP